MAGTLLFHVESQACARIFVTTPISEKKKTWSAARLDKLNFHMRLPGPHFPMLSRRLGRKHLSPDPFSKKMAQVTKTVKTSELFLIHGHDLTFPSRVQSVIEKICCHTHFEKNERRRHSLSAHIQFSSLWQGPHFSISSPNLGREVLSPHPFPKKENLTRRSA